MLDGVPAEPAWQKATPATDFRQRDPDNGAPATERTEVRVIFDKDRIVLGVTCFDSEPGKLLGNPSTTLSICPESVGQLRTDLENAVMQAIID
ncbi:MAG: hypothetical protein Q7R30_04705 [Acidobacteriota bacterium]|nr:hypothetical protein [Acidobacteriota bacterium]